MSETLDEAREKMRRQEFIVEELESQEHKKWVEETKQECKDLWQSDYGKELIRNAKS